MLAGVCKLKFSNSSRISRSGTVVFCWCCCWFCLGCCFCCCCCCLRWSLRSESSPFTCIKVCLGANNSTSIPPLPPPSACTHTSSNSFKCTRSGVACGVVVVAAAAVLGVVSGGTGIKGEKEAERATWWRAEYGRKGRDGDREVERGERGG